MTLIKSIYGPVEVAHCWFKEYIKTMNLKAGFKQYRTELCILYGVNELMTVIIIIYTDDTLKIGYKPALMDTIE